MSFNAFCSRGTFQKESFKEIRKEKLNYIFVDLFLFEFDRFNSAHVTFLFFSIAIAIVCSSIYIFQQ